MAKNNVREAVKPIILHDSTTGEAYTLEFSRESVKFAESRGFCIDDVERYPMTKIPELFFYAFRMHHMNIARNKTDSIIFDDWGGIKNIPDGVLERLGQLYGATFETMVDEKNVRVTVEL